MISLEDQFKALLEEFHQRITKNHSKKYGLKNKLKFMMNQIKKDWDTQNIERSAELDIKTSHKKEEQPIKQFSSLRIIKPKQENTLAISSSRSKLSRQSSKDLSQNESKLFNCEWIYLSNESSQILLFTIMTALISTDNKLTFKYFQDKINDKLSEGMNFSELQLRIIGNQWSKIGGLLAKSKTLRWQKILKESIDKFPIAFSKLVCCSFLQFNEAECYINQAIVQKLCKDLKIRATLFAICYRQIEKIENFGKEGPQICIGMLTHSKRFVISNKKPQYGQQQLRLRKIKEKFDTITSWLLNELDTDSNSLLSYRELVKDEGFTQVVVQQHFKSKLADREFQ